MKCDEAKLLSKWVNCKEKNCYEFLMMPIENKPVEKKKFKRKGISWLNSIANKKKKGKKNRKSNKFLFV